MQPTRCEAFGVSITTRGGSWRSRGASCRTRANDRSREPALFHPTAAPRGSTEPATPSPLIRVTVRAIRGPVRECSKTYATGSERLYGKISMNDAMRTLMQAAQTGRVTCGARGGQNESITEGAGNLKTKDNL